jgi:DNA-binding transcriptional ArsR family regulator
MIPSLFLATAAAIAAPTRLRMLLCLSRPLTVGQLAAAVDVSSSAVSYHVRRMAEVGLVDLRRRGRSTIVRRRDVAWAAVERAFGSTAWEQG